MVLPIFISELSDIPMKRWKGVFPAGDYMRAADDWHNFQTRLSVIDICSCLSEIVYALASGFIFRGTSRVFSKGGGWHLEVAESMVHVYEIHLPSSVECRSVLSIDTRDRRLDPITPLISQLILGRHSFDTWSTAGQLLVECRPTHMHWLKTPTVDRDVDWVLIEYQLRCRWSVD